MAITSLPPGFRFHPTDVELIKYYLKRKVLGKRFPVDAVADVDIYKYGPWDLPDKSSLRSKDLKWYFFCARGKKYATGARMNRATDFGYWKATGKDRSVESNNEVVGMIKTLVFHHGKAPKGDRTDWVMHEYRLEDKDLADKGVVQDAYLLCVIFQKNGPGPRNGAQYGAPFNEEDWSDDEEVDLGEATSSAGLSGPGFVLPNNQISSVAITTHLPEGMCIGTTSESCLSNTLPSSYNVLPPYSVAPMEAPQVQNDNIGLVLESFTEDGALVNKKLDNLSQGGNVEAPSSGLDGNDFIMDLEDLCKLDNLSQDGNVEASGFDGNVESSGFDGNVESSGFDGNDFIMDLENLCKHDNLNQDGNVEAPSSGLDGNDFFMELGDLGSLGGLSEGGNNFSHGYKPAYTPHHVDHTSYLELQDLDDPLKSLAAVGASVDYSCNPQQLTYPVNPFGAAQHVFGLNQSPPMLPGGPHGFEDHVDVFHKGNGANGSVNQGYGSYQAALYNWDGTPFEQSGK